MDLRERLQDEVKAAMKARAAARLSGLRLIMAAIKDREIALRGEIGRGEIGRGEIGRGEIGRGEIGRGEIGRGAGAGEMTEADILPILGRMVKQRQESVRLYLEGGRQDLADKERNEITVIEEFLPRQLSGPEVEAAIAAAIVETAAASVRDMGRVMAVLKGRFTGQMDFGSVGALIKTRLG